MQFTMYLVAVISILGGRLPWIFRLFCSKHGRRYSGLCAVCASVWAPNRGFTFGQKSQKDAARCRGKSDLIARSILYPYRKSISGADKLFYEFTPKNILQHIYIFSGNKITFSLILSGSPRPHIEYTSIRGSESPKRYPFP